MTGPIVLATYNVHGCVGGDGRRDPERIEAVIAEIAPDAIALQEFAYPSGVPIDAHDPAFFAACSGYACVRGPTLQRRGDAFGNVFLSRLPIRDVDRIDLSVDRREPRGALDVALDVAGVEMRVVTTHFGLARHERRRQVERLVAHLESIDAPLLAVVGDFNDWIPGLSGAASALDRHFGHRTSPRSFPARWPLLALDRAWVRPSGALVDLRVHRSALAREASDHLPVVLRIDPAAAVSPTRTSRR